MASPSPGQVPFVHNNRTLLGHTVDVHSEPYIFNAQGRRRLILVAFTTLHAKAPSNIHSKLISLGFNLPQHPDTTGQTTLAFGTNNKSEHYGAPNKDPKPQTSTC